VFGLIAPMYVNIPHKKCVYDCLAEYEPMRFEAWRRRQKLKKTELKY